jgi:hypothetical protein
MNEIAYDKYIPMIFRTVQELAKRGFAVLYADGRTCHTFARIASFLADYSEKCTITKENNGC